MPGDIYDREEVVGPLHETRFLMGQVADSVNALRALVQAQQDPKAFAAEVAKELDGVTDEQVERAVEKVLSKARIAVGD